MLGLKRKFEGDIRVREAGGDVFHEMFLTKPHDISIVNPIFVQGCDLHHGEFGKLGSKICWNYTLDGKAQSCTQILEVIDEENKKMVFKCIEGHLLKDYKTFVITYQVIPTGKNTCIVKWILEYEKMNKDIPEPSSLMDALISLAKEIDEHHHGKDE